MRGEEEDKLTVLHNRNYTQPNKESFIFQRLFFNLTGWRTRPTQRLFTASFANLQSQRAKQLQLKAERSYFYCRLETSQTFFLGWGGTL